MLYRCKDFDSRGRLLRRLAFQARDDHEAVLAMPPQSRGVRELWCGARRVGRWNVPLRPQDLMPSPQTRPRFASERRELLLGLLWSSAVEPANPARRPRPRLVRSCSQSKPI